MVPVTSRELKCTDGDARGWSAIGIDPLDIEVDYTAAGGCKASATGMRPSPPGGTIDGPTVESGDDHLLTAPFPMANVKSVAFDCLGGTGGICKFRIRKSTTSGMTRTKELEPEVQPIPCNTTVPRTIFENTAKCDVLVRVQADDDCRATVTDNASHETPPVSNGSPKFFSFSDVRKLTARCEGHSSTVNKCRFEVKAWCP